MIIRDKKILIGMSGGVDSSVSAALLKKQGFDVLGIFLKLWKVGGEKGNEKALEDVKRVVKTLDIPLKIIDVRKKFKKEVVEYFLKEYSAGRTPNPCIFCNENLKFKILFELANKLKIDYVATGHYARIKREISNLKSQISNKLQNSNSKLKIQYKLLEAKDKNKDQSYFLYRLKQKQLAQIIFPLGEYKKDEVRKLAKRFGLPNFNKEESQDICFLGNKTVSEFLKRYLAKNEIGEIIDKKGNILGKHEGLSLYTIGQRKGINIGGTGPYFVFGKNYSKNNLVVTNNKNDLALFSKYAALKSVNWISGKPKLPAKLLMRTRYRNPLIYATISRKKEKYEVAFENPQRAVAAGQSVVFYKKNGEVIGGGIIV